MRVGYSDGHGAAGEPEATRFGASGYPSFLLGLPKLAPTVPTVYTFPAKPVFEQLCRHFWKMGALTPDDLGQCADVDTLLRRVIMRELDDSIANLKLLDLSIGFEISGNSVFFEVPIAKADNEVQFWVEVDCQVEVDIGNRLLALEQIRPGLGQTVYAVLLRAARGSLKVFSPDAIVHDLDWMLYKFHVRESPEEMKYIEQGEFDGFPSRAELLQGLPEWAVSPQICLTPRQVVRSAKRDGREWVGKVAAATLAVADAWSMGNGVLELPESMEKEQSYLLATIRFSQDDCMDRAVHDYINELNSCSDMYTTYGHYEVLQLGDDKEFAGWWTRIKAGFKLVRAIDDLLANLVID